MTERENTGCRKIQPGIAPRPPGRHGLVQYMVDNVTGLKESEAYEITFFGDHTEFLESDYLACCALGEYVLSMVDGVVDDPVGLEDIKPVLDVAFDILEQLSESDDDWIIAAVTSGAFDEIAICENDETFAAILHRLGPKSRELYDDWTHRMFPREPGAVPGIVL